MGKCITRDEIANFLRAHPLLEEVVLGCSLDSFLAKGFGSVASAGFGLLHLQRLWMDYEHMSGFDDSQIRHAQDLLRLRLEAQTVS